MNAEQAQATDAEIDARASDPVVKAATLAVVRYLIPTLEPYRVVAVTATVVAALLHEGYTIVEKPYAAKQEGPST